jgi:tripartite-type tricarboxylate transporter receptor subunit TctC
VGRPLATSPGVPAERIAILRKAFKQTIRDPKFIAEAAAEHMTIRPMTGEQIANLIDGMISAPADVRSRVTLALEPNKEHIIRQTKP